MGDELPTGLFYIFESENDETAMRDADKFAWYFEPEYLIQSLVDGSDFYNNSRILAANLPKRNISLTMNTSTWEHSANNKEFIEKLTKLAIDELFK